MTRNESRSSIGALTINSDDIIASLKREFGENVIINPSINKTSPKYTYINLVSTLSADEHDRKVVLVLKALNIKTRYEKTAINNAQNMKPPRNDKYKKHLILSKSYRTKSSIVVPISRIETMKSEIHRLCPILEITEIPYKLSNEMICFVINSNLEIEMHNKYVINAILNLDMTEQIAKHFPASEGIISDSESENEENKPLNHKNVKAIENEENIPSNHQNANIV